MSGWLRGIVSASLLSALAMALCPPGRVRTVTKMVCGVVCALAVASPLISLDVGSLAAGMASYRQQAQEWTEKAEEEGKMQERTYIEDQCAAYICAKADRLGAPIGGASVSARWDEEALVWYPWSVRVAGAYAPALAEAIEGELGVPGERQEWESGGE